ncbi:thioredoxin family protein [Luteimonas sp. SDU101]|uniref:thioredoxin family protein n=1 Tax=Luteimonas sp. SDU101 TaxID=3422593 RepID=UPI003EB74B0A
MSYRSDYEVVEPARMDIDAAPDLVLLEFGAPWCGHCQAAQPALRALLDEAGDVIHVKVEDGRGKPLGRSFGVKLWPTVLVLRQGEELARAVRPVSAADLAPLRQALQGEGGQ